MVNLCHDEDNSKILIELCPLLPFVLMEYMEYGESLS